MDAQQPCTFDAPHLRSQFVCAFRATLAHILHVEHPKCERAGNTKTSSGAADRSRWVGMMVEDAGGGV